MSSKHGDQNLALKELKRRKIEMKILIDEVKIVLFDLMMRYRKRIKRTVKKKVVNEWKSWYLLKEQVNDFSLSLFEKEIKENPGLKKIRERNVKLNDPARLIYRRFLDYGLTEMQWVVNFREKIFRGIEITTNYYERTGNMDKLIRSGESILLEKALTKNILHSGTVQNTTSLFNENYTMKEMGKMAMRNHRIKIIAGRRYKIIYQDRIL
ncbi:MAG: hypothetical protein QXT72_02170 [Candidatus Micrarchaeia archaeon]